MRKFKIKLFINNGETLLDEKIIEAEDLNKAIKSYLDTMLIGINDTMKFEEL